MPNSLRLYFQLLAVLMVLSVSVSAQTFLEIPVKLEVEKGDLSEVVVKVKKDGKDAFTQSGASKMRFKLDFNKKYTLVFTKPGYITKTIEINTSAPSARISTGFEPYKIGVKLFLQNAENMVVYNQPVAQIKYDANIDEFNFDTDYSKSILSAISRDNSDDENKPAQPPPPAPKAEPVTGSETAPAPAPAPASAPEPPKPVPAAPMAASETAVSKSAAPSSGAEEIRQPEVKPMVETPPPPPPAPAVAIQPTPPPAPAVEEEKPAQAPSQAEETPKPVAKASAGETPPPAKPAASGDEQPKRKAVAAAGEDTRKKAGMNAGQDRPSVQASRKEGSDIPPRALFTSQSTDAPPPVAQFTESDRVTREDIVEKNRVITKIKVIKNGVATEYSRVNYNWGGQFYFRNNTQSIPENLFVQWTGVR